jgi:virginiamycin B lyase
LDGISSDKKIILIVAIAVLVIIGSVTFGLLYLRSSPTSGTSEKSTRVLPPEAPQVTHRRQATHPKQILTQSNPWGIAIDKTNGFIWVAVSDCDMQPICKMPKLPRGYLAKYSQADGTPIQEYPLPAGHTSPLFIDIAPDGHLWFTEPTSDAIGEFDPLSGQFKLIDVPTKGSAPHDLVVDKNGNIWFTELLASQIGFINVKTRQIVETPTPGVSHPYGITMDPKGNIWFTENFAGIKQLGAFSPTPTGRISIAEYPISADRPHLLEADAKGNIWFTAGFGGTIGEFNISNQQTTLYKVNSCTTDGCTHISGITIDKRGYVWFTDSLSQVVGYLNPAKGQVASKPLGKGNLHPHDGLVVDDYGTIWFTQQYGSMLTMWPEGRIPS